MVMIRMTTFRLAKFKKLNGKIRLKIAENLKEKYLIVYKAGKRPLNMDIFKIKLDIQTIS